MVSVCVYTRKIFTLVSKLQNLGKTLKSKHGIIRKHNVSKSYMLISETSKVSVLYVTAKFKRKSNLCAKVLSAITSNS